MSTRVILLRHAESANPLIFHGAESDVELSERGQRQAAAVAGVLAACSPHLIVSSAMKRAVATATPIAAACGLPLHIEPGLHERRVGALGGTPTNGPLWPETLGRWKGGDTAFAPSGAESWDAIRDRVLPIWNRLTSDHAGRTLVIVAHGIVVRVLLLSLLPGWGPGEWDRLGPVRNVALNEMVWTGEVWKSIRLGEVPDGVSSC